MGTKARWAVIIIALALSVTGFSWLAKEHEKVRYVSGYVSGITAVSAMNTVLTIKTQQGEIMLWSDDPSIRWMLTTFRWEKFDFTYRGLTVPGLNNLKIVKFRTLPRNGIF